MQKFQIIDHAKLLPVPIEELLWADVIHRPKQEITVHSVNKSQHWMSGFLKVTDYASNHNCKAGLKPHGLNWVVCPIHPLTWWYAISTPFTCWWKRRGGGRETWGSRAHPSCIFYAFLPALSPFSYPGNRSSSSSNGMDGSVLHNCTLIISWGRTIVGSGQHKVLLTQG